MNRLGIIMICAILYQYIFAQNISIRSFLEINNDNLVTTMPRYDLNDNICACVVIDFVDSKGLEFRGNIVGDIVKTPDKYVVYLPDRTKRLYIYNDDYLPLLVDFTQYEESRRGVIGGKTYSLSLVGEKQKTQKKYPNGTNTLVLVADIPLTKVIVNGQEWEINNTTSKRLVPYGEYHYEVFADGFAPYSGTVEVLPSFGSKTVHIHFQ